MKHFFNRSDERNVVNPKVKNVIRFQKKCICEFVGRKFLSEYMAALRQFDITILQLSSKWNLDWMMEVNSKAWETTSEDTGAIRVGWWD